MEENKKERKVKIVTVKKKTILLIAVAVLCIAGILTGAILINKNHKKETPDVKVTDKETLKKIEDENTLAAASATPAATTTPKATKKPAVSNTKTQTATPSPSPLKSSKRQFVVVIDPGHQLNQNSAQEAIAPGSSETKKKVTSGTQGDFTNIPEYQVNLDVSLKLRNILKKKGIKVIMTRETNKIDISNVERAEMANKANADAFIRIHCDGSDDSSANGIFTICPTNQNPYCKKIYKDCYNLSRCVLDGALGSTDANSRGIMQTDTMSGINWSKVPVTIIEMGFMSNKKEDTALATDSYQDSLAEGIASGIEKYLDSKQEK